VITAGEGVGMGDLWYLGAGDCQRRWDYGSVRVWERRVGRIGWDGE